MSTFTSYIKTGLLLSGLTGLVLAAGWLIGGTSALPWALGFAALMNVGAYFFSAKIALASMGAEEVGPEHELYQIVEPLAARANLLMPKVYLSPQQAPNAFATGRNPSNSAVCATAGLMQMLDRDEIAGVMAHELAHVKHRDMLIQTVAATLGGAISALGYILFFGGGDDEEESPLGPLGGLLVLILGPIAASIIQMAVSRSREFAADTGGAEILGDPRPLATALQKIHGMNARVPTDVNPAFNALMIAEPLNFKGGGVAKLFSTHPPLEERLENLLGESGLSKLPGAGRSGYGH